MNRPLRTYEARIFRGVPAAIPADTAACLNPDCMTLVLCTSTHPPSDPYATSRVGLRHVWEPFVRGKSSRSSETIKFVNSITSAAPSSPLALVRYNQFMEYQRKQREAHQSSTGVSTSIKVDVHSSSKEAIQWNGTISRSPSLTRRLVHAKYVFNATDILSDLTLSTVGSDNIGVNDTDEAMGMSDAVKSDGTASRRSSDSELVQLLSN